MALELDNQLHLDRSVLLSNSIFTFDKLLGKNSVKCYSILTFDKLFGKKSVKCPRDHLQITLNPVIYYVASMVCPGGVVVITPD